MLVQDKEARDDEVESLRIKLQMLERSLQEKEDTIEELKGRQYHQRNMRYEDEWEDDTPPHPREVGRFRWRGRDIMKNTPFFLQKLMSPILKVNLMWMIFFSG